MSWKIVVGNRIVRGSDWHWGTQDGNPPGEGKVLKVREGGWVDVRWDHGLKQCYRMGIEGAYDLKLAPNKLNGTSAVPPTRATCDANKSVDNKSTTDQHNPFECSICNHLYSVTEDPRRVRTLGCGHSMCTYCLQCMHARSSVTCPLCKYVHKTESADKIPINYVMEAVIQSRYQTQSSGTSSEGSSTLKGGLCKKHETKELFYCDTCKMLICVHCTVLDHPKSEEHRIIDIQEALTNKKSCCVSDFECRMKKLQDAQKSFTDRIQILEKNKEANNNLLEQFGKVMSQIQNIVTDINAQHALQTQLMQDGQQKLNQLSVVKQQVTNTKNFDELAISEEYCSASLKETENWFKMKKDSKEFSVIQERSDASATRSKSALTAFGTTNDLQN